MKQLIIIMSLVFSVAASAQHYYVVPTMANPQAKAEAVSRLFYQISRPTRGNDSTQYLFHIIKHPTNDSIAIVMDTTKTIPKGAITATQINNWITETYGTLTTTQRNTVTNYINGNAILRISRMIITAKMKMWTKSEMTARGWFNYTY